MVEVNDESEKFEKEIYLNHLPPKFFIPSMLEIKPKIGSYRIPTLRHCEHRNLFVGSLLILKSKF